MVQSSPRINPFPGLRTFELDEEHLFFGREGQADELLTRLNRTHFLAVVGTSGSGKSSLVRAGLLPSLYSGLMQNASSGWRVAILRPGSAPMGNLAAALNDPDVFGVDPASDDAVIRTALTESTLRRGALGLVEVAQQARMEPHENLLVVVDQFEELFRFKAQAQAQDRKLEAEDESAAFVKLLLGAVNQRQVPIFVVLTMRSDFLGDCAQFRDLPETLNDSQYLIPRLTREQLRSAIEGPVAVGGATITHRLVNRLLNDTGDNPDQLPILQHALMRTWDYWEDQGQPEQAIDIKHYEAIGSITEALSRHADQIYAGLANDKSRQIAETLFRRLTDRGPDNRDIRRPTTLAEICAVANASQAEVIAVVDEFRGARRSFLMPPLGVPLHDATVLDISHESLMRNWQRLRGWVGDEAQSAHIYKRLAETTELYNQGEAGYWRDPELTIGLTWLKEQQPTKAWAERYAPNFDEAVFFLEASAEARDTEAAEKDKSRRREVNRLRTFLALLGGLSLLTGGAAVYAFNQQQEAKNQAQFALVQEKEAKEQRDIAERERRSAEDAKQEAETQRGIALNRAQEAEAAKEEAQEQQVRAELAQQAEAQQRRQTESALLRAEEGEAEATRQSIVAKTQTLVAEQNAEIARIATLQAEYEARKTAIQALNEQLYAKSLTVDNLMATGLNFKALLMATQTGRELQKRSNSNIQAQRYKSQDLFSRIRANETSTEVDEITSGNRLQAISVLRKVVFLSGKLEANTLKGHGDTVLSASLSPNKNLLVSADADGIVKSWNLQGRELNSWRAHDGEIRSISFSPDGELVATGGQDGNVKLWTIQGEALATLQGHQGWVWSISFSPEGDRLASASSDGTAKIWNFRGDELQSLEGHTGAIRSISFSPDGYNLATGGEDGTIRVWDVEGRFLQVFDRHSAYVNAVRFSPDGTILASANQDGTLKIWNRQGEEIHTSKSNEGGIRGISFSPDGNFLAASNENGNIRILNPYGQELQTLKGHIGWVWAVDFSSDSNTLISTSSDRSIKIWKTNHLESTDLNDYSGQVWNTRFSPDGSVIASAGQDGMVRLWDRQGHRLNILESDAGWAWSISFSPDGKTLASSHEDGTVRLWTHQGRPLRTLFGHTDRVRSVEFSPDKTTLASASQDGTVRIWSYSGEELYSLPDSGVGTRRSVTYSPDGNRLAVGNEDGTVELWSLQGQRIQVLQGHTRWIWNVRFSPDGETLASASADGTVKLWNHQGQMLRTLEGHAGGVLGVRFWPDGNVLATASADGTIKLWDLSGKELQTLNTGANFVTSIDFSPDGKTLASSDGRSIGDDLYTGKVILWNFDLDDLMTKSCDWLRDYMANPATSPEEKALCEGYLPPSPLQSTASGPLHWVTNVRAFLGTVFINPTVDGD